MDELVYLGVALFVAVAVSVFLLVRDRKAKSLDKLGPNALAAEFKKQREDRNA